MSVDSVMKIRSKETHERLMIGVNDTLNGRVLKYIIVFDIESNHNAKFPFISRVLTFRSSEHEEVE